MICKYSIKEEEKDILGRSKLYCNIQHEICPFQYPCDRINNWRNLDNIEKKCKIYIDKEKMKYMKQGEYLVLFEKRGMLCVQLDDNTAIMVKNPLDNIPTSVELVKVKDEYYVKGFEPKKEDFNIEFTMEMAKESLGEYFVEKAIESIEDLDIAMEELKKSSEIKPKREYKKKQ